MGMFMTEGVASKLAMPLRIKKINSSKGITINGYPDLVKNHYNPGMRELIKTSKDIKDLEYLRKDIKSAFYNLNKIQKRIKLCKSQGETKKTSSYYKYIKKHYLDAGLTERDVQKTIDELNKDSKTCTEKIKQLKKIVNEQTNLDESSSTIDLLEAVEIMNIFND